MTIRLLPIDEAGSIPHDPGLPPLIKQNCKTTAALYQVVGFQPPWIGYVSTADGRPVGGGAFKGPPTANRVEIAYYTLPELEGRGFASATARALCAIAQDENPTIVVTAQTLPAPNASNALLQKLGFVFRRVVAHPADGEVWEWELPSAMC